MSDKSINTHIDDDLKELSDPLISSQRRRHIEDELEQLESYKNNHPEDTHDPSPLELFCDLNPDAPECRIYEV
jgi:hypothetical protein